eukprot:4968997-Prymnesium_polylepis.1
MLKVGHEAPLSSSLYPGPSDAYACQRVSGPSKISITRMTLNWFRVAELVSSFAGVDSTLSARGYRYSRSFNFTL